jgi:hypothetical protein
MTDEEMFLLIFYGNLSEDKCGSTASPTMCIGRRPVEIRKWSHMGLQHSRQVALRTVYTITRFTRCF